MRGRREEPQREERAREEGACRRRRLGTPCHALSFFFLLTRRPLLPYLQNSLSFSLQVVEASSSDDDSSSSDSEGAVATPAAGKKEVSIFCFEFFFSWKQEALVKTGSIWSTLDFSLLHVDAPSYFARPREELRQSPLTERRGGGTRATRV